MAYTKTSFVYLSSRVSGCPSDGFTFTFAFVIKACAALGAVKIGKEVHGVVFRTGFEQNLVVQTSLVDFYTRTGGVEIVRHVIDTIPQPDSVPWNAVIAGSSSYGFDWEALDIFREIVSMDLKPDLSTLASIVPVCTRLGCIPAGTSLHVLAVKSGYLLNDFLVPALISTYAGDGDLCGARNLFDSVVVKNVTVWNAMISAHTQRQKPVLAFELFLRMLLVDILPNLVTFVSINPSCENSSSLSIGGLLSELNLENSRPHEMVHNIYAAAGRWIDADRVRSRMKERRLRKLPGFSLLVGPKALP